MAKKAATNPDGGDMSQARTRALRILRVKLRSTSELRKRLKADGFDGATIDGVLAQLAQARLVNDAALAESEVRRMKDRGVVGLAMVRQRLFRRGLTPPREIEASTKGEIIAFARKRLGAMPAKLDATARARRLLGLLARRGISADVAMRIASDLLRVDSDE